MPAGVAAGTELLRASCCEGVASREEEPETVESMERKALEMFSEIVAKMRKKIYYYILLLWPGFLWVFLQAIF